MVEAPPEERSDSDDADGGRGSVQLQERKRREHAGVHERHSLIARDESWHLKDQSELEF